MCGHSVSHDDIRTHCSVTSQSTPGGRHDGPCLPAALTPAALRPQLMCPRLPQCHWPLHRPSLSICSASVSHASHGGLGCIFPGPHQVSVAVVHISRHTQQEGSFDDIPCRPGRLKNHRLSPHCSDAGQPSGLPWILPQGIKGSAWLSRWGISPLPTGGKGDAPHSAPTRHHQGTMCVWGPRQERGQTHLRGSRGDTDMVGLEHSHCEEGLWGQGWFSME